MANYVLEILDGDRAGDVLPVGDAVLRIGRKSGNDLVLADEKTSGVHCEIAPEADRLVLKDLGSTNGTRVNARDITESPLSPADTIQFGSIEFIFEDGADTRGRRPPTMSTTKVTEETGGGARPETFESISPFGAEKPQSKRIWFFLIALIGVLALGVVVYYFIKLIGAS